MKKYLVIGNPIEHSLSPKLHNHWIKENNINAMYDKKQLNENEIKGIIDEIKNEKINGINVTVPFKKSVIPFLDLLTPLADETQSVNTIYKDKDKIIVSNIGGPLKHLKNEWYIKEINNQCEVSFTIDFEIKNVFYNMIMKKSFDLGLKTIADAFEKSAIQLLNK